MASPLVERAICDAAESKNAVLKFISPNDVGKTGSHQCGYYLPRNRWEMFTIYPPEKGKNETQHVQILWPDGRATASCIKWYGRGTRSEYRLTRFGPDFPYLTPDSIGNLLVLIRKSVTDFRAYVFDFPDDIEDVQAGLGVDIVESIGIYTGKSHPLETENECINKYFREFVKTLKDFPRTSVFSETTLRSILKCTHQFPSLSLDGRLMELMEQEYALFRMAERVLCQHDVCRQYKSIDDFLSAAARIMNRRKSRAGRSLENHVAYLLGESKIPFDMRAVVDGRPDVLIPGKVQYRDLKWPLSKLFAVGIKTTCKDRWRQVLNEAKRVRRKHILTIQQGISVKQLEEMRDSNVCLIVPEKLRRFYPQVSGMEIMNIDDFVASVQTKLNH